MREHTAAKNVEELPVCPRCGYDQSGIIGTWNDACPLEGRCSECGLEFHWTDVINAHRLRLNGFVEHERGGWLGLRLVGASIRTLSWTVLPWRFWSRVKMHHAIRPRRWVIWGLLLIFGIHVLNVASRTATTMVHSRGTPMVVYQQVGAQWAPVTLPARPVTLTETAGVAMEFMFTPVAGFTNVWSANTMGGSATLHPLSAWKAEWWPDPSTRSLAPILAAMATFPIMMLFLPHTRKEAKVRMGHVARGAVYSLSALILIEMVLVADAMLTVFQKTPRFFTPTAGASVYDYNMLAPGNRIGLFAVLVYVGMPWLPLWWLLALQMGYRIRNGWMVWGIVMIPALLTALIAAVVVGLGQGWLA